MSLFMEEFQKQLSKKDKIIQKSQNFICGGVFLKKYWENDLFAAAVKAGYNVQIKNIHERDFAKKNLKKAFIKADESFNSESLAKNLFESLIKEPKEIIGFGVKGKYNEARALKIFRTRIPEAGTPKLSLPKIKGYGIYDNRSLQVHLKGKGMCFLGYAKRRRFGVSFSDDIDFRGYGAYGFKREFKGLEIERVALDGFYLPNVKKGVFDVWINSAEKILIFDRL
ncbi:hypothetical protein [Helicobacter sp. 11S03491-1]|uniref:hypothetical protein n=1 Tax=Helicobacter sp. 11S03491-1 TaxID=1476196 RepID=UPI000BA4F601|nr:hypothetical protein [Helicobacter sp. 11S03491-1]PAF43013.1 hypothetical protein BKH45_02780 [Helicobacter sp. 11S03491-1]